MREKIKTIMLNFASGLTVLFLTNEQNLYYSICAVVAGILLLCITKFACKNKQLGELGVDFILSITVGALIALCEKIFKG